jgi:hypothetical protein
MLTLTSRGRRDRKRLAGVAVVAATITALSAGPASAQEGARGVRDQERAHGGRGGGARLRDQAEPGRPARRDQRRELRVPEAGFPIQHRRRTPVRSDPTCGRSCARTDLPARLGDLRGHAARVEHRAAAASLHAGLQPRLPAHHHVALSSCFRAQRESARASSVAPPLDDARARRSDRP